MEITPGKWKVHRRNGIFDIVSEHNVLVAEADTHLNSKYHTPVPRAVDANAKAISAVPELIRANESAIKVYIELGIKPTQSCYKLALEARDKYKGL